MKRSGNKNRAVSDARKPNYDNDYGTLLAGSKVDIPLWLAIHLARRSVIELKNPIYLSKKYFDSLKASSEVLTMRQQSPYLYENVLKICEVSAEESSKEALLIY